MTQGDVSSVDGPSGDRAASAESPATPAPPPPEPTSTVAAAGAAPQDAGQWLDATCPYLRSTDGSWRSVVPQRGQRCWGQQPPVALEPLTQERLCRTEAHTRCEIFVAAEQGHLDALARDHVLPERLDGRFGVLVRPSTLVLDDSGPVRVALPVTVPAGRRTRVAIGLGVAGVLVVVALLAGLGGGAAPLPTQPPPIAFVSPSPVLLPTPTAPVTQAPATSAPATSAPATPLPTPVATPQPTPEPTPKPTPKATPTPTPTPTPSPSQSPGIRTTYRIHKGDTLAGIAAKFGVTKKQLRAVNDFGDPPHLRYGFVINIPYP